MTEPRTPMVPNLGELCLDDRYWLRSVGCFEFGGPVVLRLYWPASDPQPNVSRRWRW